MEEAGRYHRSAEDTCQLKPSSYKLSKVSSIIIVVEKNSSKLVQEHLDDHISNLGHRD
jgi:hypothetical protein